jgi:ABC-2 type transport system permease protein
MSTISHNRFSANRVAAMVLRYLYLLRRSWPRQLELIYWPAMQMVLWGLISQFFVQHSSWLAQASGVLLAAVMLWDVLFRGHLGVSLPFIEEMYARNLGHLFVSPLKVSEHISALLLISLLRTSIGLLFAALLATALYAFNIFDLGLPLLVFFFQLIVMGWATGLGVVALILRYGLGAESLAWVLVFALAPLSAVYYPVDTLPPTLQLIAAIIPASHAYEGMRALMFEQLFRWDLFWKGSALNLLWLGVAIALYLRAFARARQQGSLLQGSE